MTLISFMVNQKGYIFYNEDMKPAGTGALRFWWYFQRDSYAVLSDLLKTIPFMTLISFMVKQKGYIFYHEGMKPASAGTLRFFGGIFSAIAMLCLAIYITPYPS